jgi:hypothetical protein
VLVGRTLQYRRPGVVARQQPPGGSRLRRSQWERWVSGMALRPGPGQALQRITDDAFRPATGFYPIMSAPEPPMDRQRTDFADWRRPRRVLLYEVPAAGGSARPIAGGGFQATALTLDQEAGRAVLAATPPDSPGALYLVEASRVP